MEEDILKHAKKLRSESFKDVYEYEYMSYDPETETFSLFNQEDKSRKGFEKFKETSGYLIDYPGQISARKYYKDNELKGIVLEKKTSTKTQIIEEMRKLAMLAERRFIEKYKVSDIEAFEYYILENSFFDFGFSSKSDVDYYFGKVEYFVELEKKYKSSKDFRNFFNKIIYKNENIQKDLPEI